jgi:hypothetical protein
MRRRARRRRLYPRVRSALRNRRMGPGRRRLVSMAPSSTVRRRCLAPTRGANRRLRRRRLRDDARRARRRLVVSGPHGLNPRAHERQSDIGDQNEELGHGFLARHSACRASSAAKHSSCAGHGEGSGSHSTATRDAHAAVMLASVKASHGAVSGRPTHPFKT